MAKVVADQRARGGGSGRPVLYVLIASFVLIAAYMIFFLGWSGMTSPTSPQQSSSQNSSAPASSSSSSSSVPAANPVYPSPSAPAGGTSGSAPAR